MNILFVFLVGYILCGIIYGLVLRISKGEIPDIWRIYIEKGLIIVGYIIVLIYLIEKAETMIDVVLVVVYFNVTGIILWGGEKYSRNNALLSFVFYIICYPVMVIAMMMINKHILEPVSYLFIVLMAISNFKIAWSREDFNNLKKANVIGILLVIGICWLLSEPYAGLSKQEHRVISYIINEKGNKRNDIDEIGRLTNLNGEELEKVYIRVKGKFYIYHYINEEIVEIESYD